MPTYTETPTGGALGGGDNPPPHWYKTTTRYIPNWDTNWTTTSIASSSVAAAATSTTGVISNDNKSCCEVSVKCVYGNATVVTGVTNGLRVFVLRDLDGSNYETQNDNPWGFCLGFTANGTWRKVFDVSPCEVSQFKVSVYNNTDQTATVTVNYRQATVDAM